MAQEIIWHSTEATIARDTETGVVTVIAPAAAVQRQADRDSIVTDALVWLAADSAQAAARSAQIAQAIADVDTQIASVNGYTFAGTNVNAINASLNNALKPQLAAILAKQRAIGVMLQELQAARARHGQQIAWIGRLLTS